jgi:hypothetical protein
VFPLVQKASCLLPGIGALRRRGETTRDALYEWSQSHNNRNNKKKDTQCDYIYLIDLPKHGSLISEFIKDLLLHVFSH